MIQLKIFNLSNIMPEQQTIKYKSSWHDDYLKWMYGLTTLAHNWLSSRKYCMK